MSLNFTTSSDKAISVQDFIALRASDDITYYNYSILQYLNGFEMFITNILYDYDEEFQDIAITIKLNEMERIKYRYKPDLLAYDIYGSVEAKFILMMLNGIIDPKEFDFKKIKAVKPGDLKSILNRIQAVNDEYLSINRSELKKDIKENDGNSIWEK